ncbi:hypothetical protein BD310DRAFT_205590 [Dichomitus squalens]|uniref:Uncharacterized protein n=1 Tax=Dichomitus squalens TaxID=114155 RepID=A0A4Q9PD70_9APHY|nr:hypothetical protein BD310DRAFT_205590 [Dichomitus squalens]
MRAKYTRLMRVGVPSGELERPQCGPEVLRRALVGTSSSRDRPQRRGLPRPKLAKNVDDGSRPIWHPHIACLIDPTSRRHACPYGPGARMLYAPQIEQRDMLSWTESRVWKTKYQLRRRELGISSSLDCRYHPAWQQGRMTAGRHRSSRSYEEMARARFQKRFSHCRETIRVTAHATRRLPLRQSDLVVCSLI